MRHYRVRIGESPKKRPKSVSDRRQLIQQRKYCRRRLRNENVGWSVVCDHGEMYVDGVRRKMYADGTPVPLLRRPGGGDKPVPIVRTYVPPPPRPAPAPLHSAMRTPTPLPGANGRITLHALHWKKIAAIEEPVAVLYGNHKAFSEVQPLFQHLVASDECASLAPGSMIFEDGMRRIMQGLRKLRQVGEFETAILLCTSQQALSDIDFEMIYCRADRVAPGLYKVSV